MADNREWERLQLFDLMFKLILIEAIPAARSRFINRLSGKSYPLDREAAFAATESVNGQAERLERIVSGMVITIAGDVFFRAPRRKSPTH